MQTPTSTTWKYLASNPKSAYRQLFIAGRRIRAMDLDGTGVGERDVSFEIDHGTPAGLYWLRLTQVGRSVTMRVIVLQ